MAQTNVAHLSHAPSPRFGCANSLFPTGCRSPAADLVHVAICRVADGPLLAAAHATLFSMVDRHRVTGWKEIGAALGTSGRTAMRWANERGLPVEWIEGRGPKRSVFAYTDKLETWSDIQKQPERAKFQGNRLSAFNAEGQSLWTYEFPVALRQGHPSDIDWRVQVCSIAGRTGNCVLALCSHPSDRLPVRVSLDELYCFGSDGSEMWKSPLEPNLIDRNGQSFEKAWRAKHMLVSPSDSHLGIWVALANEAGWAGCVLRHDPRGSSSVQVANAGHVEHLCWVQTPGGGLLAACGENNDYDRAFVAICGEEDPPWRSPLGQRPRYQYQNAPSGSPRRYILFPPTELIHARDKPYGHAWSMRQLPGEIIVHVETGGEGGDFLYHFSETLEPRYVFPSGSHEFRHQRLEQEGRLSHSWADCPELDAPLPLRIWEPATGWRDASIPWRDNPWKEK
jgi:hypothetical protein